MNFEIDPSTMCVVAGCDRPRHAVVPETQMIDAAQHGDDLEVCEAHLALGQRFFICTQCDDPDYMTKGLMHGFCKTCGGQ